MALINVFDLQKFKINLLSTFSLESNTQNPVDATEIFGVSSSNIATALRFGLTVETKILPFLTIFLALLGASSNNSV